MKFMKKQMITIVLYIIVISAAIFIIYNVISALDAQIVKISVPGDDYYAFTRETPENYEPPKTTAAEKTTQNTTGPLPDDNNSKSTAAVKYTGDLELPVDGATGYASVDTEFLSKNEHYLLYTLKAGTAFQVILESGDWWLICPDGVTTGWVQHIYCMINLPDVIPSIIYNNTNAYSSIFRCFYISDINIPGITGGQLYKYSDRKDGKAYNKRLQKYEYIVPVLYSTAKRIYKAQKYALKNGETLVVYEGYRPNGAQTRVYKAMLELIEDNPDAQRSFGAWSMTWFIASGISSHQFGYAIDVSLAKVVEKEEAITGKYKYTQISMCIEYIMPTPVHELSSRAVTFTKGVAVESFDAWQNATLSEGMLKSPKACDLQKYCTDAGLTPLASEWWQFNDLYTLSELTDKCRAEFEIKDCLSVAPEN